MRNVKWRVFNADYRPAGHSSHSAICIHRSAFEMVGDPGLAPGRLGDFKSPGSAVPAEASRRKMVGMKGIAPPRLPDSKSGPSAIRVEPHAQLKLAHPAGLPPANSPFEAEDDHNFTTDAENWIRR